MIKKRIIPFITLLFFSYLSAQGVQFAQTITVDDDTTSYGLTFGFSPDYTDGYEDAYCSDGLNYVSSWYCEGGYCVNNEDIEQLEIDTEQACEDNDWTWYPLTGNTWAYLDIYAAPAPPAGVFDAALAWENVRYYKQIVAGLDEDVGVEHVWNISLQYAENNLINITWNNIGWADLGEFVLQDAFGGVFINVNMVDGSGPVNGAFASLDTSDPSHPVLSIINTAVNTLKLMVIPSGNSSQILGGFTADVTEGESPLTVTFSDQSTATENTEIASWDWDFGDENTSTEQNPTHTYAGVGNYTVNLTVSDETGVIRDTVTAENFITVIATPTAGFTYTENYLNVSFMDASVVGGGATIIGWLWDFGDETTTSTEQNPVHTYAAAGAYTVSLTVTSEYGSDSATEIITVEEYIAAGPAAGFTYVADYLNVSFTDISVGGDGTIISWNWDFGDGNTSTEQNPTHTYSAPETFTVSLTVTDENGLNDTYSENVTVEARPPIAGFTYTMDYLIEDNYIFYVVTFTDISTEGDGTIITWAWDFGDGTTTSTDQNPTHLYENTGSRSVTLTVEDNFGLTDTYTEQITVYVPLPSGPTAGFSATPMSGNVPLIVTFTDASTPGDGVVNTWAWDFGDGETSDQQSPTHTYTAPGTYSASLFVTDENSLSDTETQGIEVLPISPTADFTYEADYLEVTFTDATTAGDGAINNWSWDFDGDGVEDISGIGPHTYTYTASGTYTVSLTVTDENSESDTYTEDVIVVDPVGPTAGFTFEANYLNVSFTDTSVAGDGAINSWSWNFGDNSTSTEQNPTHTYTAPGTYTVSLTVESIYGSSSATEIITVEEYIAAGPAAGFTYVADYLNASFTDISVAGAGAINSLSWDFGDGNTSTEQNPTHTYTAPGTYQVSLTVTDENSLSHSHSENITVVPRPPEANFTHTEDFLIVSFTDASVAGDGAIITWAWDFGDGSTSTEQNPTHTYTVPGTYQVSLTVIDENSMVDTYTQEIEVIAPIGPTADFTHTENFLIVSFTDVTTTGDGAIITWLWDFGDGSTSTEQNPTHTYTAPETYTVSLTVTDENDLNASVTQDITVEEYTEIGPAASFSYSVDFLEVIFTDISVVGDGAINSWSWDFGDGETSDQQSPTHAYTAPETYTVSLTVTDENGESNTYTEDVIVVAPVGPTAGFSATPTRGDIPLTVAFTDASTAGSGDIESWLWDFGDGVGTSDQQNPGYTYAEAGTYTVSLTVTDENNTSDTVTEEGYITVIPSVYPGDTNNDGFVNGSDVLPLGIYFYKTGPQRSTVGYNWSPSSPDSSWNPIAATYADANGDGIINERDLFGIGLNWGMTPHTNGSNKFVVDPGDSTLLTLHKPALERLYQALGGNGEPTQQMKLLLERILGIEHIPDKFYLYQNYPNPFNPSTTIKFDLQDEEYVTLNIFDIGGKLVEALLKNKYYQGGTHTFTLQADHLSNGLYFYQITAGKWQSTQKMIILK